MPAAESPVAEVEEECAGAAHLPHLWAQVTSTTSRVGCSTVARRLWRRGGSLGHHRQERHAGPPQQQHSIGRDGVSLRRRGVVGAASTLFKPSWDERLHDKSESDESERVEAEVSKVEVNARRGCASNIELELVAGDIMQSRYEQF